MRQQDLSIPLAQSCCLEVLGCPSGGTYSGSWGYSLFLHTLKLSLKSCQQPLACSHPQEKRAPGSVLCSHRTKPHSLPAAGRPLHPNPWQLGGILELCLSGSGPSTPWSLLGSSSTRARPDCCQLFTFDNPSSQGSWRSCSEAETSLLPPPTLPQLPKSWQEGG